ncbi:MAG: trigger factor [Bauldia sp.]
MQVTETFSEGLKREFRVVVPQAELDQRLTARLDELKGTARIKGFRPGKVPVTYLRRLVGRQTMSELLDDILKEKTDALLRERGERTAIQPVYNLPTDEKEAEKVLDAKADLEYQLRYEVLPLISLGDFKSIAIERPTVDVSDEEIDRQLLQLARGAATYSTKEGPAAEGDRVTIDYVGKIGDDPFEGGADTDSNLVLGSKQFIPGFEDQLVGASAGDKRTVVVTFPADYGAPQLAGKEANFDVTVKEVASADSVAIDDTLATKLGLENVAKLREAVAAQLNAQNAPLARQRVKRQLLDALDAMHQFDAPPTLVEQEFDAVWREVNNDLQRAGRTFEDEGTTEEAAREYYRQIANRRVRLGLVLAEIGERNRIDVTDQELQRALAAEVRRNPGQEKALYDYYQASPANLNRLRAPLFEEKVVDFLLELANVTDRTVSRQELVAMLDADEPAFPKAVA